MSEQIGKFILNDENFSILEQISEEIPGGFFIYHADGDEELIYYNRAMLRIFGCDTKEEFERLTGNSFKGIVHPDDYKQIEASIEHQIKDSLYDLDYVEYRIIQKDGTVRWLEDYGHFVHTEAYGDVFYVFVEDATERLKKRMENLEHLNLQLKEQYEKEKQYRKAILSDATAFFEVNLTTDLFITEAVQLENGKPTDLFAAMGIKDCKKYSDYLNSLVECADLDERDSFWAFFDIDRLIKCYTKGEREQIHDCWITSKSGRRRLTRYVLLLGKNDANEIIALSITKDMTEQVERQHLLQSALQQAKVASVAREVFLSNMSHDIRTPLNAIIGYTELAKRQKNDVDKVADYIEKIRYSSEQLLSILNESLELTRMESGNVSLTKTEFNIEELLADIKKDLYIQIKTKDINFNIDKTGIENYCVYTDFVRIKEILAQLLDNAVKYTDVGGNVTLTITEKDIHLKGYRQYKFVVEDNGRGISEEFMDKLFEPFARENNTTMGGVLGTGLGLALVKNIVDMLEGELEVKSTLGEGSSFSVTVLFELQKEQSDYESIPARKLKKQLTQEKVRILLAEDNSINREIIAELLGENGYIVESGENGQIVFDKLKNSAPGYYSMIIMDIQMPVMDGYEATKKIRDLNNKALAQIPIVALSANAFAEDFQKSREVGMDAHIAKPVDANTLFDVIKQMV